MAATENFSPLHARGDLLERERELAALTAAIDRAVHGRGAVVSVVGSAGIGKTRLMEAARDRARAAGATVAWARGSETEVGFSFAVVKQLFEPLTTTSESRPRQSMFAGAAASAASVVVADVATLPVTASPDRSFAVVHGLFWLCVNLAQMAPLVLLVDDLHLADEASVGFLGYLAARVDELPVTVVVASRPIGDTERARRLEAVTAYPGTIVVSPASLSVTAVSRLVGHLAGMEPAPAFAQACHQATDGNPFLCQALLTAMRDEGAAVGPDDAPLVFRTATRAVSSVVVRRMTRAAAPSIALAQAVSVLGDEVDLNDAANLAALNLDDAVAAADALAVEGILQPGSRPRFTHPLVRACVYDRIPPARRALLHNHAAAIMHDRRDDEGRVAAHLLLSLPQGDAWVVEALSSAAERACGDGDPAAAVSYLRRALDEPPCGPQRAAVRRQLGLALLQAGEVAAASEHLRIAHDAAEGAVEVVATGRDLAIALTTRGDYPAAVAVLERCADLPSIEAPDRTLGVEAELHQSALMDPTQYRRVSRRLPAGQPGPAGDTPGQRAILATMATEACLRTEPAGHVRDLAARAFDRGLLTDHSEYASLWGNAVFPLIFAEGYQAAAGPVERVIGDAVARASPVGLARAFGARAVLRFRQGHVLDAEADARASVDLGLPAGIRVSLLPLGVLLETLVERADLNSAEEALRLAGRDGPIPPGFLDNWVLHGRGWLRLAQGRFVEAAADFAELGRRGRDGWRPWNPGMFAYRSGLALARWHVGDRATANDAAAEEVQWAQRWGGRRALGLSLRTAGQVDLRPSRVETLTASVDTLDGSGARLELAKSLVALGSALRREGRRRDASAYLHDGMALAERCGGTAVAKAARGELVTLGERPRRAARYGVDSLTASERRVALLAAGGASNRDIAQSLFVTLRTVEVHLTSAYRKLGITQRTDLAKCLAEPS